MKGVASRNSSISLVPSTKESVHAAHPSHGHPRDRYAPASHHAQRGEGEHRSASDERPDVGHGQPCHQQQHRRRRHHPILSRHAAHHLDRQHERHLERPRAARERVSHGPRE